MATLSLSGPLVGVGVDIVENGRVSARVAARIFTATEREAFSGRREVPFAGREAVLKAVGGPGVLGAPLREMCIAWDDGRLRLDPGPRYQAIMAGRGVAEVRLALLALDEDHTLVSCVAAGLGAPEDVRVAWALRAVGEADEERLSPTERAAARGRPASIATRCAAREAGSLVFGGASFDVAGGIDLPPTIASARAGFVSLAHEKRLAVALVATRA